jgi:uncharacterized membrane-anchored protein YhcB (DUF1043 family)
MGELIAVIVVVVLFLLVCVIMGLVDALREKESLQMHLTKLEEGWEEDKKYIDSLVRTFNKYARVTEGLQQELSDSQAKCAEYAQKLRNAEAWHMLISRKSKEFHQEVLDMGRKQDKKAEPKAPVKDTKQTC